MTDVSREQLLAHLRGDERRVGEAALDWGEQARGEEAPVNGDFLDALQQKIVRSVLLRVPTVGFRLYGGYAKAERKRVVVFPHFYLVELIEEPITALDVAVDGEGIGHRDLLDAVLAAGVQGEQLGDVIVTATGGQVIVAREIAEAVLTRVQRVGRSAATVQEIDLDRIEGAYDRVREIRTTVASMRLDAIAGSGFGESRTKMRRHIKAERVKLNWSVVTNPAREVRPGDVISMRGRGRVVITQLTGISRKGRVGVLLQRHS